MNDPRTLDTGCDDAGTTLMWAYGEAPASHALHVSTCPVCSAIAADHEGVATALGPALSALRTARPPVRETDWRRVPLLIWSVALAAAILLALVSWPERSDLAVSFDHDVVHVPSEDPIEAALDDLDLEVLDLELELL